MDDLVPKLLAISERRDDMRIFIRADETISYGEVMKVMGKINNAGFNKVALVTRLN